MLRLPIRPLVRAFSTTPLRLAQVAAPEVAKLGPFDGIPFKATPEDTTKGELGQVELPEMRDYGLKELELKIPGEPDNYTLTEDPADAFPSFHEPQVITVAHVNTHHGGGPSHGVGADDVQAGEEGDSITALPSHADVSIKPIVFNYEDRDLNGEEQRGLYVLGGIFLGGFLLGGLGKKSTKKAKKEEKH